MYEVRIAGSSYTNPGVRYTKTGTTHSPAYGADGLEFKGASSGDILNLFEKLILDSSWQVLDEEVGSTFLLGRSHMFYKPSNQIYKRIIKESTINSQELTLETKRIFESKNTKKLFSEAMSALVNFNLIETDLGMKTFYETTMFKKEEMDDSVYDTLVGSVTKKFSENHFAISGHNLIFHEIAVNDYTYNTLKLDYSVLSFSNSKLMTILPKIYASGSINKESKTLEKIVKAPVDIMLDQASKQDGRKAGEFLSNELLKELRWAYQGKIFMTFTPNIKIGDTVSLVDNITSTFGKFYIDSFEHKLDARGMVSILNVKACFDIVDPYIDVYSKKIALEISEDVGKTLKNKTFTSTEEIALNNLLAIYMKSQLTNIRYCEMIECEEPSFFDKAKEYGKVDSLESDAPILAVRFIPFSKKGRMQIPESLKSAFTHTETNPFGGFIEKMNNQVQETLIGAFRSFSSWNKSLFTFLGDTVLDILSFGLHEIIKAVGGYNFGKGKKAMLGTSYLTDDTINILNKETDYVTGNYKSEYDLTFGFFNVEAQRKTNMTDGVNNDKTIVNYDTVKSKVKAKSNTIQTIIKDYFDVCGCVEMYDSFKFDNSDYEIKNFINDVRPITFNIAEEKLFTNTYGTEKGVLFYDNAKLTMDKEDDKPYFVSQLTKTFKNTSGDTTRCFVETTIDVKSLGYKDKNGDLILQIKFIWFHNLFGDTDLKVNSRYENIKHVIEEYGSKYAGEFGETETYDNYSNVGVVIMGDYNLEVVNPGAKPKKDNNIYVCLDRDVKSYGFRNYMTKPTTLSKDGNVTGSVYENVLLSPNLINNDSYIDVFRVMYDYPGVKRSEISDHVPAFVGFKKRN
ncbi:MAG: hypothetical protein ACRCZ9_08425 [Fusobacteriaceae bacterium]